MKPVNIFTAEQIKGWDCTANLNGKWRLARPYGFTGLRWRLKMAWMVFNGDADVLTWVDQ